MTPTPEPNQDFDMTNLATCIGCNTSKHVNAQGLCGRCSKDWKPVGDGEDWESPIADDGIHVRNSKKPSVDDLSLPSADSNISLSNLSITPERVSMEPERISTEAVNISLIRSNNTTGPSPVTAKDSLPQSKEAAVGPSDPINDDELKTAFEDITGMRPDDWPEEFKQFVALVRQREEQLVIDELQYLEHAREEAKGADKFISEYVTKRIKERRAEEGKK